MIELRGLGGLDLRSADGHRLQSILGQPKRVALLTYLAVARPGGSHARDLLLSLFWPESPQDRARRALNQALYVLRSGLGDHALRSRGGEVGIDPEAVWCDVVAFERALEAAEPAAALELYRGDLLPGFHVQGAPDFEAWLESERARLRGRAAAAARELSLREEARENPAGAARWARRALEIAPFDESGVRRLLDLLDAAGDRAGALLEYEAYARRLAQTLDLEPEPDTASRAERLRRRPDVPSSAPQVAAVAGDAQAAPIEAGVGVPGEAAPASSPARPPAAAEPAMAPASPQRARRRRMGAMAGALLLLAALTLTPFWQRLARTTESPAAAATPRAELAPRAAVAVLPFENRFGGDSGAFGRIMADWVTQGIARAKLVDVLPLEQVLAATSFPADPAHRGEGSPLSRIPADHVVRGSYVVAGDTIEIHAEVVAAEDARPLGAIAPVRVPADAPLEALERVRQAVMGVLAARLSPEFEQWSRLVLRPPTYEAYQEFMLALEIPLLGTRTAELWQRRVEHLLRASELDTTFVTPLLHAAWQITPGELERADSILRVARRRASLLSPAERFELAALEADLRGDKEASYRAVREAARLQPDRYLAKLALSAQSLGRYAEAADALRRTRPEPGHEGWWYWEVFATANHYLGRHEDELRVARTARRRDPAFPRYAVLEMIALAALGRAAELDDVIDEYLAFHEAQRAGGAVLARVAQELRLHGHAAAADSLFERAFAWWAASAPGDTPPATPPVPRPGERRADGRTWTCTSPACQARLPYGIALYRAERYEEARAVLEPLAMAPAASMQERGMYALAAARLGDREAALRLDAELGRVAALEAKAVAALLRARLAAVLGDRERALAFLRQALAGLMHPYVRREGDQDFEPYLEDPDFQRLLQPRG